MVKLTLLCPPVVWLSIASFCDLAPKHGCCKEPLLPFLCVCKLVDKAQRMHS